MRYHTALLGLAMLLASPLSLLKAENGPPPDMGGKPGHQWNPAKMQKDLGLSDDQVAKLKAIMDQEKQAMKPLWDKQKDLMKTLETQVGSKAKDSDIEATIVALKANRTTMKDQHEGFQSQRETLLTPTQQAKMLLRMKDMFKHRHHGGPHKGPQGPDGSGDNNTPPDAPPTPPQNP